MQIRSRNRVEGFTSNKRGTPCQNRLFDQYSATLFTYYLFYVTYYICTLYAHTYAVSCHDWDDDVNQEDDNVFSSRLTVHYTMSASISYPHDSYVAY